MYILAIEYSIGQQVYQQKINALTQTKSQGIVTIGRDPANCDLVLADDTVSREHIKIYFDHRNHGLKLRNLTSNRPKNANVAIVDGNRITNQKIKLS